MATLLGQAVDRELDRPRPTSERRVIRSECLIVGRLVGKIRAPYVGCDSALWAV